MNIEEMKQILKEKKITYEKIAEVTGYSKSCITKIFGGFAKYPRQETVNAIENAIKSLTDSPLDNGNIKSLSDNEKKLLEFFSALDNEGQNNVLYITEKLATFSKKK